MPTSAEVRQQFLDFFMKKCGHVNVPSSPVVPHDDPTLLFANAGMNQFKPYFLGTEKPKHLRVVNTQKCIRAGGKHNDLDDVGKDTYHHTFFEMLGNWSFGDYFKKEAITWAWELLTSKEWWGLDPTRLHVTVFEGDPANGIPRDDEAADIWKSVGVLPGHVHLGNKKDNFWEMGETGPCGPCTEIHYDSTPDKSGAKLVNGGSDQCVEIWNNVFIQFNRNVDKSLTPLPAKHVDTGMGFERVTKVLQGKNSNYDTDVFTPIFDAIQKVTKARPYGGKLDDLIDTAYRVIGDHIRTLTFAITDGANPGNKGRNAVLRSILRRASRYGWQVLGMKEPFLHKLVDTVVTQMGDAFPELKKDPEKVVSVIYDEEKSFLRTLEKGLKLFNYYSYMARFRSINAAIIRRRPDLANKESIAGGWGETNQYPDSISYSSDGHSFDVVGIPNDPTELKKFLLDYGVEQPRISGKDTFHLHTTFGLDKGITQQMASEAGLSVDMVEYERLWEEFVKISEAGGKGIVISAIQGTLPPTDDFPKYDSAIIEAHVLGWVKDNQVITNGTLQPGDAVGLLLDQTNFYAEQGGQVGDTGVIDKPDTPGFEFRVDNTIRLGDTVLHMGVMLAGELSVDDKVTVQQTLGRRIDIMRNHTATHLMNLALRQVLGQHVEQKGSLVDDEKTRFDFSHDQPLTADQLRRIETQVNREISRDLKVSAVSLPIEQAKKVPGVRAMFGEKYPDVVRVVMIGPETPEKATHDDSVEFCGGTHVPSTGTIGYFKMTSQEGVAKGVRRVTAVTGRVAAETLANTFATVDAITTTLNCRLDEAPARLGALQDELDTLRKQVAKQAAADLAGTVDALIANAVEINGTKIVIGQLTGVTTDLVRVQADRVRQKLPSAFITFGWSEAADKVSVLVALTNDVVKKGLKSGEIVKQLAAIVGGSGGGKPDLAQAGGKDPAKLGEALKQASEIAKEKLQ